MVKKVQINQGWHFKQASTLHNSTAKDFLPVAQFPTVAHLDLLHHKLIPDPYIDKNELDCLWINDADWTYQTSTFPNIRDVLSDGSSNAVLVFEGLDTIVDVFLNGTCILNGNNMHVSYEVDVTDIFQDALEKSREVILELRFKAAPEYGRAEMKRIGYKGAGGGVSFGGPERLFVRKAQYHWGWDWGPALNTCGPWKGIHLDIFEARITDFLIRQEVAADLKTATLKIKGNIEVGSNALKRKENKYHRVSIRITSPKGEVVAKSELTLTLASEQGKESFDTVIVLQEQELWYPFTHGAQPLFNITAEIGSDGCTSVLDSQSRMVGLRRLRLLQNPLKDAEGTSFIFEINNIRIFCGGSCWIPGDYLLPRMTPKRYEDWLLLAKSGNQVMIRVWGGGIVESDDFYNTCDREGILVWQDFLFACGNYPASDDFVENVKNEAEQHVKRVGYHASLALWAGNNEDYMLAEMRGWGYDQSDKEGPWDATNFPARKIYERILPEVCERLAGDVPYWRSSPYGGSFSNDTTVGDTHIWNVWHGPMSPYQAYKTYLSRFISEFGFESAPNLRTLHQAITMPSERHWQSRTFDAHDKGPGHQRRYGLYSSENFRFSFTPLANFVYCSQFLQAEAMKYAYNHWRREFRGEGQEYCAGILIWQLNDIWPGTSWALVDVNLSRKASFYITKRALAKMVVGMERIETEKMPYMLREYLPKREKVQIWGVNGSVEELEAVVKVKAFDIESGKEVPIRDWEGENTIILGANRSQEIMELSVPNAEQTVMVTYLLRKERGDVLARWVDWPEPLKYVRFSKEPKIEMVVGEDGNEVVLKSDVPVKGVMLGVKIEEGEDATWDDNFIDLVPGEEIRIRVEGLRGRGVDVRWLGDWELEMGDAVVKRL